MRQGAYTATRERGAILMFVLLVTLLIAAITLGVMQLIQADSAAGVREMQAVQAFNVAEGGMHYALAQLQVSGSTNYAGETKTIMNGSTTLGTATITVNCIDTGGAPSSCSGPYAGYRRIVSVGTLPVGGPTRTVVAVVKGSSSGGGGPTYAVCNTGSINTDPGLTVYGDWGTNSNFDFAVPYGDSTDVLKPCSAWTGGKCPGNGTSTGKIVSAGTVTCDGSCSAQFPGGVTNNASPAPCGSVTLGAFAPGATSLSPGSSNFTLDGTSGHGYSWNNVTIGAGTLSGSTCTAYRDLTIVAPATAGTTQVVQMNQLTMNQCSRLIISGPGNIDLRIASTASGEGGTLYVYPYTHFGVLPTDTASTPAPVPAGQLTVEMQNTNTGTANYRAYANAIFCADSGSSTLANACIVSGYFMIPNGLFFMDYGTTLYGAVVSTQFTSEQHDMVVFDASSGGGSGSSTYTNFTSLMSWKDE